ncbi:hypothetical protein D9757_007933 [Collybiopsis confluens]|uniref:Uncharacterized protein n=1 Tax=Collybiopsis confluens TaxID=2823264 RepID=A0A8H5HBT1_9AGAR|nr:hypothetical protein D9757_007933 [Collybiopsis confluens]
MFSVPEDQADDMDHYLNYNWLPLRWEESSDHGLEKYQSMSPPTATFWGIEYIMLILTFNSMKSTDPNYRVFHQDKDAFLSKCLEALSFDKSMLNDLKWHMVSP